MSTLDRPDNSEVIGREVDRALAALEKIKKEWVDPTLRYYTVRAPWHRRAFRISGTLVILMSVTIPFLVERKWEGSDLLVSALSLSVAALTSLMSFYQWQSSWHKHIRTQLMLENMVALWQLELAAARQQDNSDKAIKSATEATRKLLVASGRLTLEEAQEFFDDLKAPTPTDR